VTIGLTILSAVVPSLLLLWYFYKRDLNPEPRGVLIKTFLLGIVIVVPVIVFALPLWLFNSHLNHPMLAGLYCALLCAAVPEEFFKYLVVTRYNARHPAFDEPMDGVVYGAAASLGFATLENVLYVMQGGWTIAIARAFTAVPCHACLGAILGYYVGQARFNIERRNFARLGLLVAIVLHALYDFPLLVIPRLGEHSPTKPVSVVGLLVVALAVLVFEIVWTLRIVRRLHREQIQDNKQDR
jgi:RsiW-degrading membrane proteinase PrsW (M82 family)